MLLCFKFCFLVPLKLALLYNSLGKQLQNNVPVQENQLSIRWHSKNTKATVNPGSMRDQDRNDLGYNFLKFMNLSFSCFSVTSAAKYQSQM